MVVERKKQAQLVNITPLAWIHVTASSANQWGGATSAKGKGRLVIAPPPQKWSSSDFSYLDT